ncbi:MAG: DUF4870 domain-containing protein [Puniceicoccaceae bacterium]
MTTPTNDKLWNVLCHLSVWLGVGIILPLIVYLVTKDDPESSIPAHAKESLNFHISMYIYGFISLLLFVVVIGMILLPLIALATAVLSVVGAVKASNGEVYQYPATIRLVK